MDGRYAPDAERAGTEPEAVEMLLRSVVVGCTLGTAFIHASLGGVLFAMNAIGYATLAVALILPLGLARRFRLLARLALLGFTAATIVGWVLVGARFPLAYLDKGIELVLVGVLLADIWRADGGPSVLGARILGLIASVRGRQASSAPAAAREGARLYASDDQDAPRKKVA